MIGQHLGGIVASPPGAGSVLGWSQCSIDFAALGAATPQDFKAGGDGVYTIGGVPWTITNTANTTSAAIGATGIGAVANGGAITAAAPTTSILMCAPLLSYIPSLSLHNAVRLTAYNNVNNKINSWEGCYVGICPPNATDNARWWRGGNIGLGFQANCCLAGTSAANATTTNPAHDVIQVEIPSLAATTMNLFTGAWAAGFPAAAAMQCRGQQSVAFSDPTPTTFLFPADVKVHFVAQPSPTQPNFSFRFSRLLIEWK